MPKVELTPNEYAKGMAAALREDYGGELKRIGDDTGAASGTIKKWLAEDNAPGGEYLIKLMAASPAVRRFVDTIIQRDDLLHRAEARLQAIASMIEGK